jgi:hypothetical protein
MIRYPSRLISCAQLPPEGGAARSTGWAGGGGGAINVLVRLRELATPAERVVTSRNVDTLYSLAFVVGKRTGNGHSSAV